MSESQTKVSIRVLLLLDIKVTYLRDAMHVFGDCWE